MAAKFILSVALTTTSIICLIMTFVTNEPIGVAPQTAVYFKSTWASIFTLSLIAGVYCVLDSVESLLRRLKLSIIEERIEIARKAILAVRHKIIERQKTPRFGKNFPEEYSYGCVGILDFIKTGKPELVLVPDTRACIERLLAEKESLEKNRAEAMEGSEP